MVQNEHGEHWRVRAAGDFSKLVVWSFYLIVLSIFKDWFPISGVPRLVLSTFTFIFLPIFLYISSPTIFLPVFLYKILRAAPPLEDGLDHYRMLWTCTCGYKGCDYYAEHQPGSVQRLAETLQGNGLRVSVDPCAALKANWLDRCLLAMSNVWPHAPEDTAEYMIIIVGALLCVFGNRFTVVVYVLPFLGWYYYFKRETGKGASGTNKSNPSSVPATFGINFVSQSSQAVGSTSSSQIQTSSSSVPAQQQRNHRPSPQVPQNATSTVGAQPNMVNIPEDFILLCFRVGKFLTERRDISVSGMTRDRELFAAFRAEHEVHLRWAQRNLGLWTVQNMNFVKSNQFDLYPRNEVDRFVVEVPPASIKHYDFDPRTPTCVPPIGNDILMHRFTSPKNCFNDDFCLPRIPKRLGERPSPGIDPDYHTGWGIHLEEGLNLERLFLWILLGCGASMLFGILWAIFKRSMQDGFAVAAYVVAIETLGATVLQLLLAVKAI